MSSLTRTEMTNHHHDGILGLLTETLHVWRERAQTRQELAHLTERDLHDVGLSAGDAAYEADKPFWQA
jgi:uncharacterized protein YjiS (DUF1127 family)